MGFTSFIFILAVLAGLYVYLFGIPPALKSRLQQKSFETMGENRASYLVSEAIDQAPESNRDTLRGLQQGYRDVMGGGVGDGVGKWAGGAANEAANWFSSNKGKDE